VVSALFLAALVSPSVGQSYFYSFETSMEGWVADATDVPQSPQINWSITRSTVRAYHGFWSLAYYIDNYNDATKIWIEKSFTVTPGKTYDVAVSWRFATPDSSHVNNWNLIAAVQTYNPEMREDFVTVGSTYNGGYSGWRWINPTYKKRVTVWNSTGKIWVGVGLWGTWEVARTYFVDAVNVAITPVSSSP
jgi:hypothetical protein